MCKWAANSPWSTPIPLQGEATSVGAVLSCSGRRGELLSYAAWQAVGCV